MKPPAKLRDTKNQYRRFYLTLYVLLITLESNEIGYCILNLSSIQVYYLNPSL